MSNRISSEFIKYCSKCKFHSAENISFNQRVFKTGLLHQCKKKEIDLWCNVFGAFEESSVGGFKEVECPMYLEYTVSENV